MQGATALVLIAVLSPACTSSGYRKATVIEMARISEPANLSDDPECRTLWGDIARYGIEMDRARNDWNQVILGSAELLIERRCVKRLAQ